MSARFAAFAACAVFAGFAGASASAALPEGAPVTELLDQCEEKDGWSDPAPPLRVFANVYYVGTCGITSLLIVSDQGYVLIEGGPEDAAPLIAANIEALGLALGDVEWIVTSHEHYDHVGGVAELQRLTGAKVAARAPGRAALEAGMPTAEDPQYALRQGFPRAPVSRTVVDGETVTLGPLTLTAHATPGHTPGSTTWSWRSCEGADCKRVVYADSVSAVSADDYRFSDHPAYLALFRRSLDTIAALDCDLLLTPHPGASTFFERLAGDAPLMNPESCRNYADYGRERLETRLQEERSE